MKVICAGMSKCGTKSVHAALAMLDYSVHDYPDAFENFETKYSEFVIKGWKTSDFKEMYESIDVVIGGPAYFFWEELLEAFPDAKVVLMTRDDDETWYKSYRAHVILLTKGIHWYYYPILAPSWRRFFRFLINSASLPFGDIYTTGFETYLPDPANIRCKQAYRRHIAHVINKCPEDKLLVYNCKSGWKPLCDFLGKPVRDEPFPRLNLGGKEAEMIWHLDILKQARKEVQIKASFIVLALGVTCCYVSLKTDVLTRLWR